MEQKYEDLRAQNMLDDAIKIIKKKPITSKRHYYKDRIKTIEENEIDNTLHEDCLRRESTLKNESQNLSVASWKIHVTKRKQIHLEERVRF